MLEFCIQFALKVVPKVNWTWISIDSGNGVVPNKRQAITWTNCDSVNRRIYAALGGDELITFHAINGAVCIQLTLSAYEDCDNMCMPICNCLGLRHEIMVSVVCLSIFL